MTVQELRDALDDLVRAGYGDAPVKLEDALNEYRPGDPERPWWSASDQAVLL